MEIKGRTVDRGLRIKGAGAEIMVLAVAGREHRNCDGLRGK